MTPTRPGDPGRERSAPPTITDLARWIGGDMHAAYRAAQWCIEEDAAAADGGARWWARYNYALGHLHALEAVAGRTVPRE